MNQGAAPGKTGTKGAPVLDDTPTLRELGISKKTSARSQQLAKLTAEAYESGRAGEVTVATLASTVSTRRPIQPACRELLIKLPLPGRTLGSSNAYAQETDYEHVSNG